MRLLLAIDPGPELSAWLLHDADDGRPVGWAKVANDELLDDLSRGVFAEDQVIVEMIASYGMPVGAEVFETCVWIGRFTEAVRRRTGRLPERVKRIEVKSHLCHSARATDANIRAALIDRYGPGKEKAIGRKATPGPLYGISGDCWAALAVAVTAAETRAS